MVQYAFARRAIDNGSRYRMTEYNPYTNDQFGDAEGDKYVDFLVNTLKPFIDKNTKHKHQHYTKCCKH